LIVTEWKEFRRIEWDRLRSLVEHPLSLDGRNPLKATDVTPDGFHYISLGWAPMLPARMGTAAHQVRTLAASKERWPDRHNPAVLGDQVTAL